MLLSIFPHTILSISSTVIYLKKDILLGKRKNETPSTKKTQKKTEKLI